MKELLWCRWTPEDFIEFVSSIGSPGNNWTKIGPIDDPDTRRLAGLLTMRPWVKFPPPGVRNAS